MATITLLPDNCNSRAAFLDQIRIPENYMGDFSLMGLLVTDYGTARKVLDHTSITFRSQANGTELTISGPKQLMHIMTLLQDHGIGVQYTDIADTLYQA